MEIEINKISKKLKNLREEHNLTQQELAKNLGVTRQSIISLERGRCLPSLPLAISFSRVFEIPFEEIFIEEMENINQQVENMFEEERRQNLAIDNLYEDSRTLPTDNIFPKLNLIENDDNITIIADLPGVIEEDLSIEAGDESIIIKGNRKDNQSTQQEKYNIKEIEYGKFWRTIPLPYKIIKEETKAKLKDGVLYITLKKELKKETKVTIIKIQRG